VIARRTRAAMLPRSRALNNMKKARDGLRPIFPRKGRGVFADESGLVIRLLRASMIFL
jgi:hypothetical protein